jgi:hypothetical protein
LIYDPIKTKSSVDVYRNIGQSGKMFKRKSSVDVYTNIGQSGKMFKRQRLKRKIYFTYVLDECSLILCII